MTMTFFGTSLALGNALEFLLCPTTEPVIAGKNKLTRRASSKTQHFSVYGVYQFHTREKVKHSERKIAKQPVPKENAFHSHRQAF